jgi:cytochrome c biogenesis protein CcmG/thiol:disulfide interchange protein DsbE
MKFYKIIAVFAFVFSTLLFTSCSKAEKEVKDGDTKISAIMNEAVKASAKVYPVISTEKPLGKKAGDFVWKENGKEVRFSEFTKGKYVLLNFWGTWCPPCRRELPDLVSIAKDMANKNFVVIGAALEQTRDLDEAFGTVSDFWVNNSLYYPVVVGTPELANAYGGINAVPTTFLINDNGEIVSSLEGGRSKDDFMLEINKMMKN